MVGVRNKRDDWHVRVDKGGAYVDTPGGRRTVLFRASEAEQGDDFNFRGRVCSPPIHTGCFVTIFKNLSTAEMMRHQFAVVESEWRLQPKRDPSISLSR